MGLGALDMLRGRCEMAMPQHPGVAQGFYIERVRYDASGVRISK